MNHSARPWGQRIRNLRRRLAAALIAIGASSLPAWGTASAHDHAWGWNLGPIANLDELIGSKPVSFISPLATREWMSPAAPASNVAARVAEYRRLQESLGHHWTPLAWSTAGIPLAQPSFPVTIDPIVAESLRYQAKAADLVDQLTALASEEPIDAAMGPVNADAAWVALELPETDSTAAPAADDANPIERPRYAEIAGIGVAPMIATLEEPYLAYDLSPEDLIAMRMYPIPGADADYFGGRRTGAEVHGPGLPESLAWEQVTESAEIVSTPAVAAESNAGDAVGIAVAEPVVADAVVAEQAAPVPNADWLVDWARLVMSDEATGGAARAWLDPVATGNRIGELAADGTVAWELAVAEAVGQVAAVWTPAQPLATESLLAEATLMEPRPERVVDPAEVADEFESPRVPPLQLAHQTALEIVTAQAAEGAEAVVAEGTAAPVEQVAQADSNVLDPIARAEAVATACDHAAATLERLAMSLRRAGDTLVRHAKAGSAGADGSMLR
jgi:hypothetical protein